MTPEQIEDYKTIMSHAERTAAEKMFDRNLRESTTDPARLAAKLTLASERIAELTQEAWDAARDRNLSEADSIELRCELLTAEAGRKAFYDDVVELRAERSRAAESMQKMQARLSMIQKVAESMDKGRDREDLLNCLANEMPMPCPRKIRSALNREVIEACGYPTTLVAYPSQEGRSNWECHNCGNVIEAM